MDGPNVSAPDTAAGVAGQAQGTDDEHRDSAATLAKLQATTAAEFARLGFGLLQLADGSFVATKWTCCRPLVDLQAARAFLRQIGGAV